MRITATAITIVFGFMFAADAQGWGGRGGNWGRGATTAASSPAAAMVTHKGKIFLINGSALHKIDKESLKIEATVSLKELLKEAQKKELNLEEGIALPQRYQRYDTDGDGKIEKAELENDRVWGWFLGRDDLDKDDVLTAAEAQQASQSRESQASQSKKAVIIKIDGDDVLVLANDRLYKFAISDLTPRKSVDVTDPEVKATRGEQQKKNADSVKQRKDDPEGWKAANTDRWGRGRGGDRGGDRNRRGGDRQRGDRNRDGGDQAKDEKKEGDQVF